MLSLLVGALVLMTVFGPKVGPIDVIALGDAIALVNLVLRVRLHAPPAYRDLLAMASAFLGYSYLVHLLHGSEDPYVIARSLRMWVSTAALGLLLCNVPLRAKRIVDIVLVVLLVHALFVLAQMVTPSIKLPMGRVYGFDKPHQSLRAFGLTGGYDGAGMLCMAGVVVAACVVAAGHRVARYYLAMVVFGAAAVCTGRTAMVALAAVVVPAGIFYVWTRRGVGRLLAGILLVVMAAGVWLYVGPVLLSTVPELGGEGLESGADTVAYRVTYASATLDVLFGMLRLPPDPLDAVLGAGFNPPNLDLGYVKMIFMTGVVGLILAIGFYLYMALIANGLRRRLLIPGFSDWYRDERASLLAVMGLVGLMLVFNFKSLFFFSRSTHELCVVLFCGVYAASRRAAHAARELLADRQGSPGSLREGR